MALYGETETLEIAIHGLRRGPREPEGYEEVALETSRGEIEMRSYSAAGATAAALFVGGAGGGWDTPGCGRLYPHLCGDLQALGVDALRVRYRHRNVLEECVLDALAGLHYLERHGAQAAIVIGHSFGGAVAAQVAASSELVRAVVLLSTQSFGTDVIAGVAPGCATLLVHGTADQVLPVSCSRWVYDLAPEPKELRLYPGAGHGLDEDADRLHVELREWILERLPAPAV